MFSCRLTQKNVIFEVDGTSQDEDEFNFNEKLNGIKNILNSFEISCNLVLNSLMWKQNSKMCFLNGMNRGFRAMFAITSGNGM